MTIEMEAGASQLQCSTKVVSAHLILTLGPGSARVKDENRKGVARLNRRC